MGKFRQLSPELWPLIDVRNSFSLTIFANFWLIFFKLCMRVDIGKSCFGIADELISSSDLRVMALN